MDKSSQSQPLSQSSTTGGLIDGVAAAGHNLAAKVSEVASSVYATAAQATAPTMGQKVDANLASASNNMAAMRQNVADTISPPQTVGSKIAAAFTPSTTK